jgi:hypothetical protein
MRLVLSAPVGSASARERETSTKRVTALGLSPMSRASTTTSRCSVMPGGATAASAWPFSKRDAAACTLLVAGMCP